MPGNVPFVAYPTSSKGSAKHIRSRRACSQCRHRKRRCIHQNQSSDGSYSPAHSLIWMESQNVSEETSESPRGEQPSTQSKNPRQTTRMNHPSPQRAVDETQADICTSDTHTSPLDTRFVGDLNPEARLLDQTTTPEDAQNMAPGEVGVWVQPHVCGNNCSGTEAGSPASRLRRSSMAKVHRSYPPVSDMISGETTKTLTEIYFANIHPIIPLLNENEYWQLLSQAAIPVPLVHVVCLLASKDTAAERHLKLVQSGDTLISTRKFCSQLYHSISSAMIRHVSLGKITLMRILGLLSLHQEGNEGMEGASSCISQAMHLAQSLALHLPRPNDNDNELKRIFWCLWVLDRLNSATNSRPCIMADTDIGVPELMPGESGSVAFDICFKIVKMLNTVIGLYRPNNTLSGWDDNFPGFETILDDMHAWNLNPATISTLQIFYSAMAILAHRLKTITTLPSPTPSRLRQQLCATNVIKYLQGAGKIQELYPFPIVVYTTSLALSVSYQQLRYSRLPCDQEAARQDFHAACAILQILHRKWSAADAMGSLAHRISVALDRLPNLEMLRVNRSELVNRDHSAPPRPENSSPVDEVHPVSDIHMMDHSSQLGDTQPYLDSLDLFAGMDDVSWMYLDAENPVNFGNFSPMYLMGL